jgi:hypothetical protein
MKKNKMNANNYISFYNFLKDCQRKYFGKFYDCDGNEVYRDIFGSIKNRELTSEDINKGYVDFIYHIGLPCVIEGNLPYEKSFEVIRSDVKKWSDERINIYYSFSITTTMGSPTVHIFHFKIEDK